MSHVSFNVNLEDLNGMEQVMDLISGFINMHRVKDAKARYEVEDEKEVDAAGEKWDPEKHSANRTKLEDGTWRRRRQPKTSDSKPVPPPPSEDAALAPEEISYKEMMDTLKGKGLSMPEMNELAKRVGEPNIGLLINRPELIPALLALADRK